MPEISLRGIELPASPIRKLVPFAESAKKKGIHVYHLNIGQPDIETPQIMLDAVRNFNLPVLEYSHSAGIESYRKKLVNFYKSNNIFFEVENILITTGGSEALLFSFLTCFNPNDEVIVFEPLYANYNSFAIEAGVKLVPITSYIENGFALPNIEEIEKKITSKTKGILICNPNNPTGYVYSLKELEAIKKMVLKHHLFLISDEAYRDFSYDEKSISALEMHDIEQHVIVVDTISKRYSACGGRIGFFISKNKEVMETALKLAQARLSSPTFAQIAGEAALNLPTNYFDIIKLEYKKRRDLLISRLQKMKGVFCTTPKGAFYVIAQLPIDNGDKFCQWLLEKFSFNQSTVMLAPASGFYATKNKGLNEVRIAYVLNCKEINLAMDCLEVALEKYQIDIK